MSLRSRITRLEHALGRERCSCPNNTDLSWPGHNPPPHCNNCGGERQLCRLTHHPRDAEPLLRAALPLYAKAYNGGDHPNFDSLTDQELKQLRNAFAAHEANH